jgi:hypothetical protein
MLLIMVTDDWLLCENMPFQGVWEGQSVVRHSCLSRNCWSLLLKSMYSS